jgi:hypothetical protein
MRINKLAFSAIAFMAGVAIIGSASMIAAQTVGTSTDNTVNALLGSQSTSTPDAAVGTTTPPSDSQTNAAASTTPSTFLAISTSSIATSSPANVSSSAPPPLTCTMAYTADLYDTVSGHAAPGANVIGTQAWTDCNDGDGNTYEFKITPEQYAALAEPDAQMPEEVASTSAELTPADTALGPIQTGLADSSNAQAPVLASIPTSAATSTDIFPVATSTASSSPSVVQGTGSSTPASEVSTSTDDTASTTTTTTP